MSQRPWSMAHASRAIRGDPGSRLPVPDAPPVQRVKPVEVEVIHIHGTWRPKAASFLPAYPKTLTTRRYPGTRQSPPGVSSLVDSLTCASIGLFGAYYREKIVKSSGIANLRAASSGCHQFARACVIQQTCQFVVIVSCL